MTHNDHDHFEIVIFDSLPANLLRLSLLLGIAINFTISFDEFKIESKHKKRLQYMTSSH